MPVHGIVQLLLFACDPFALGAALAKRGTILRRLPVRFLASQRFPEALEIDDVAQCRPLYFDTPVIVQRTDAQRPDVILQPDGSLPNRPRNNA